MHGHTTHIRLLTQVAYTLHDVALCVGEAGHNEEAENLFRRTLTIKENKLGRDDARLAYTLHNLGVCVLGAGRNQEAIEMLRRALVIREATLGPNDLQVAVTLHELGVGVLRVGREDEASASRGVKAWGVVRWVGGWVRGGVGG